MLLIEVSLDTIDQLEALVQAFDALESLVSESNNNQVQNLQRLMEPHMKSLHEVHDSIHKAFAAASDKKYEAEQKGVAQ